MKKILITFLLLFVITGCGNEEIKELNIKEAEKVVEETLKNMTIIDNTTLEDVYGLDLALLKEYVIKQNTDGDLYAILKTNDKVNVKDDMKDYFEKVEKFNENYSPERLEIFNNRLEKEVGDYLIYIIATDAEQIYDRIIDTME